MHYPGDVIWVDAGSRVLVYYRKIGVLRQDLAIVEKLKEFSKGDWFIFQYRQTIYGAGGKYAYPPLQIFEAQMPVLEIRYQDIPLMSLYTTKK